MIRLNLWNWPNMGCQFPKRVISFFTVQDSFGAYFESWNGHSIQLEMLNLELFIRTLKWVTDAECMELPASIVIFRFCVCMSSFFVLQQPVFLFSNLYVWISICMLNWQVLLWRGTCHACYLCLWELWVRCRFQEKTEQRSLCDQIAEVKWYYLSLLNALLNNDVCGIHNFVNSMYTQIL